MDAPPILRPMTTDEIAAFRLREIAEYTAEMVELGGMVLEAAAAKARASDEALFPGGQRAPGHHFLVAIRGEVRIGRALSAKFLAL